MQKIWHTLNLHISDTLLDICEIWVPSLVYNIGVILLQ